MYRIYTELRAAPAFPLPRLHMSCGPPQGNQHGEIQSSATQAR
jgi:hypothetical protein